MNKRKKVAWHKHLKAARKKEAAAKGTRPQPVGRGGTTYRA